MKRVAVIGGGISGTAAAYFCTRNPDVECTLFESTDRLGGTLMTRRIRLPECGDFIVEMGPDGWVSEKPWATELAIELGMEAELVGSNDAERRTLLLRNGQLQAFPEGMRMMVPLDDDAVCTSPLLSETAKQAYLTEPGRADELRILANATTDISVADFCRRHFGEEVTHTFAGPLLAGVFGGDIETLSARSVMPAFLAMAREHGSLILALRARQSESRKKPLSIFTALSRGNDSLIEKMAEALPPGCAQLEHPVYSLAHTSSGWLVTTGEGEYPFDSVLLATPAHVSRRMLVPVDARLAQLHEVPASSGVMAALLYTGQIELPRGFGFLVEQPQPGIHPALLAATFSRHKYPHSVPPDAMLLRVFFGGTSAARVETMDDAAIAALAQQQLQAVLPGLPQHARGLVQRWPLSLPQYCLGHEERVQEIESRCAASPGLYLLGNAYRGVGLPDMVHRAQQLSALATEQ
jgi:oxygen-dependent protoporphyrinogen oxidase